MIWGWFQCSDESNLLHLVAFAACIFHHTDHQRMCAITYFQSFLWNLPVFHSAAILQLVRQAWWLLFGLFMWNISYVFWLVEYYLWCSDWLKLLRGLAAQNPQHCGIVWQSRQIKFRSKRTKRFKTTLFFKGWYKTAGKCLVQMPSTSQQTDTKNTMTIKTMKSFK